MIELHISRDELELIHMGIWRLIDAHKDHPEYCAGDAARKLAGRIHSLKSDYDTEAKGP